MQQVPTEKDEPGLFEKVGSYAEKRLLLLKYKAVDTGAEVVASLVAHLTVVVLLATFLLILNIGIALWIGHLLGYTYYGFFIVAAFYALVALLVYSFRHKLIKEPLNNLIIRKILKQKP